MAFWDYPFLPNIWHIFMWVLFAVSIWAGFFINKQAFIFAGMFGFMVLYVYTPLGNLSEGFFGKRKG